MSRWLEKELYELIFMIVFKGIIIIFWSNFLDPITGPAEDLGFQVSLSLKSKQTCEKVLDSNESDGSGSFSSQADNNNVNESQRVEEMLSASNNFKREANDLSTSSTLGTHDTYNEIARREGQILFHIPSLSDMLIGFPTQKGYIAYRKPEVGSWYMNAVVQVFSKHAHNTDLCAMLNMVNSLISGEVTNTGKKQMSEFTSKLTKPYFYFFPG
jgi:uncharacterized protein YejL (UPF0352 family)